jgi:hypothetical protein
MSHFKIFVKEQGILRVFPCLYLFHGNTMHDVRETRFTLFAIMWAQKFLENSEKDDESTAVI